MCPNFLICHLYLHLSCVLLPPENWPNVPFRVINAILPQFRPYLGNWKEIPLGEGGSQCVLSECHRAILSWVLLASYFDHSISHTICDICYGAVHLSAESWFIGGCLSLGITPTAWRAATKMMAPWAEWLALLVCGELKKRLSWANRYFFPKTNSTLKIASKL